MFEIRPYHPTDLTALYRICLQTGDNGNDASALFTDSDLLAHFYAGPYAVLSPELCFVLTQQGMPIGYVLGVRDSAEFAAACEADWFPTLRERYQPPSDADQSEDAGIIRLIYSGHSDTAFPDYPAHLHIDILPEGQGHGFGRKLLEALFDQMRTLNVPAVLLEVSNNNPRAIGFYERIGFEMLEKYPGATAYGMRL